MVERFIGTWKLISSEGFEDYMKNIGVPNSIRKMGNVVKPTLTISKQGDDIHLKTDRLFKTTEIIFKLGVEFEEITADNRISKTIITLENGVMTQIQKWDNKETTIKREIIDGQMVVISMI
ncbi:myelin P2 protein-like isoform X2 [Rhinatrema bivittatum]|uniref:myelin P2 protein-like isoform X2 n=1 Tax=Rhinatrema bivittatum TaxID=194408 RepID=UPI00112ABDF1|nr:myelin P2 protein-like isoform X2 [Rhinatrema bivittatum]